MDALYRSSRNLSSAAPVGQGDRPTAVKPRILPGLRWQTEENKKRSEEGDADYQSLIVTLNEC
ncbi:MAG: hypothetical protein DMF61_11215 [Blastocatellia bacterium AA13]|nr:MAG: hypothetical protein DMF61_11215 [Blastocatellia bacterium AA13]